MSLFGLFSRRFVSLCLVMLFLATGAYADQETGQQWLSQQVLPAGGLAGEESSIAAVGQARAEVAMALLALQVVSNGIPSVATEEADTESLARYAIWQRQSGMVATAAQQELLLRQQADGGFGHLPGWKSNPVDTALTLMALADAPADAAQAAAVQYLLQDGLIEVFYADTRQQRIADFYTLSALTAHLPKHSGIAAAVSARVAMLEQLQMSPGQWAESSADYYIDALLNQLLHAYRANSAPESSFRARVLGLQQGDGSWNSDPYVTAVVLRALSVIEDAAINPLRAAFSLSLVDTESGVPLSGFVMTSVAPESASAITTISNADGSIAMQDIEPGLYRFTVSGAGYIPLQLESLLSAGQPLDFGRIQLSRLEGSQVAVLSGVITAAPGNSPLANVLVTSPGTGQSVRTNADGRFQIVFATGGSYALEFTMVGYASTQQAVTVVSGSSTSIAIAMLGNSDVNGELAGRVLDAAGQPLAAVSILRNTEVIAATGPDGRFAVPSAVMGPYILSFNKAGYVAPVIETSVSPGVVMDIGTVVMQTEAVGQSVGTINFRALNSATGVIVKNVKLLAEQLDAANNVLQRQVLEGLTEKSLVLASGRWRLTASHPAYSSTTMTVPLAKGQVYTPTIFIRLQAYSLSGVLLDSQTNQPLPGVAVRLLRADNSVQLKAGTTDANGNFLLTDINVTAVKLEIKPLFHLETLRYFDREFTSGLSPSFGEIRLRPASANELLPDLVIKSLDDAAAVVDVRTLFLSGSINAVIGNRGKSAVAAQTPFAIKAFADENRNGVLDLNEPVLGAATVSSSIGAGQEMTVSIPLQGSALFRDAPVTVMVDATHVIPELREGNNIRLTSDAVSIIPPFALDAEIVWQSSSNVSWTYMTAGPLRDTNADGKINANDTADVVVRRINSDFVVLDGVTGATRWQSGRCEYSWHPPVIADLDADGIPEVAANCFNNGDSAHGLYIYSNEGQLLRFFPAIANSAAADSAHVVDLNADGKPEILLGAAFYTYATGVSGYVQCGSAPELAVDLDGDNVRELLGTQHICDFQGNPKTLMALAGIYDRMAIGDVFSLSTPQIIRTYSNLLYINSNTGKQLAKYTMSGGLGVPTIADYDCDGRSDIGVSTGYGSVYSAFRADGSVIWSIPVRLDGNNLTIVPAFDFDGDGCAEAVIADKDSLYVVDGPTGALRLQMPNLQWSNMAGAIVLDADVDGHADILLPSSDTQTGIRLISSRQKDWAATRNVWNETGYYSDNINADLSAPQQQPKFWETHNSYRANVPVGRNAVAASDATASFLRVRDGGLSGGTSFTVRIGNAGGKSLGAAMPVSFWRGNPALGGVFLGTVSTSRDLIAGDYEDVAFAYLGSLSGFGELFVAANEGADRVRVHQEVSRDNNVVSLEIVDGFGSATLDVATDKVAYGANDAVVFTAELTNLGSFAATRDVRFTVLDAAGDVVVTLPLVSVSASAGGQGSVQSSWNSGTLQAGVYSIQADVLYANGVIASASSAFTIQGAEANASMALTASVVTSRASYGGVDPVQITARLINPAPNQVYNTLTLGTVVTGPDGQVVWSQADAVAQLQPQGLRDLNYTVLLQNAAPGSYRIIFSASNSAGDVQATATGTFSVVSAAQSGQGLSGMLQMPVSMVKGESVSLGWSLRNQGNAALADMPVRIVVISPLDGGIEAAVNPPAVSIGMGSEQGGTLSWLASLAAGRHVGLLQVEVAGQWQTKAQQTFLVTLPAVSVSLASAGLSYRLGESLLLAGVATNQSPVRLLGAQSVIRVFTPAGALWHETRTTNPDWAAAGAWPQELSRVLAPAPAGNWRAEVRIEDADGVQLSQAEATFSVQSSLVDGAGLSGALTVSPAEVETGQSVVVGWQLQNAGNADFVGMPLQLALRKVGENVDEQVLTETVSQLSQGGAESGFRSVVPSGVAGSQYTVALSVEVGGQLRLLSEAGFVMKAPVNVGEVDVVPAPGSRSRLLVYYSCHHGWHAGLVGWILGQHNASCFSQREQVLRQYLDQQSVPYLLVKNESDFVRALRGGDYNNYWLLGAVEKLSPWLVAELREAVNRGDSLVIDGVVQSWFNFDLYELAGVSFRGRLNFTDSRLHLDAPVFAEANRELTPDTEPTPLFLKVNRGDVTAWWEARFCNGVAKDWDRSAPQDNSFYNRIHERYPAIVSGRYGQGRTLVLAFDLIASLKNATASAAWQAVLTDSLTYTVPDVQLRKRVPGESATFTFPIRNGVVAQTAIAELTLPAGARYLGASVPGSVQPDGRVRWVFTLAEDALQMLEVDVRAPVTPGSYSAELAVWPQGSTSEPQRFAVSLEVDQPLETRITRLRQQIESLTLTSGFDRSRRTLALLSYQQAQLAFNLQLHGAAIDQWVAAAGHLGNIGQTSAAPIRQELDLLIKELEARWAASPR